MYMYVFVFIQNHVQNTSLLQFVNVARLDVIFNISLFFTLVFFWSRQKRATSTATMWTTHTEKKVNLLLWLRNQNTCTHPTHTNVPNGRVCVRERAPRFWCVRWEYVSVEYSTNGELTTAAHMHTKWLPAHAANSNTTKQILHVYVCVFTGRNAAKQGCTHSHAKAKNVLPIV